MINLCLRTVFVQCAGGYQLVIERAGIVFFGNGILNLSIRTIFIDVCNILNGLFKQVWIVDYIVIGRAVETALSLMVSEPDLPSIRKIAKFVKRPPRPSC